MNTHTPQHPSQEWRGAAATQVQAHTPRPYTPARSGGVQVERAQKHKHTPSPQSGLAGRSRNPSQSTTQTQTQAQHNSRKPSVHSPSTEAARAMQVTRPNEIRSPGVRLHPKACAAFGLEAERATLKQLRTPVPRTCMHALGTGYARKGSTQRRRRVQAQGHSLPASQVRHAGCYQPSWRCPGLLCWGPPVRCSRV